MGVGRRRIDSRQKLVNKLQLQGLRLTAERAVHYACTSEFTATSGRNIGKKWAAEGERESRVHVALATSDTTSCPSSPGVLAPRAVVANHKETSVRQRQARDSGRREKKKSTRGRREMEENTNLARSHRQLQRRFLLFVLECGFGVVLNEQFTF
jgi:hypothetical protein